MSELDVAQAYSTAMRIAVLIDQEQHDEHSVELGAAYADIAQNLMIRPIVTKDDLPQIVHAAFDQADFSAQEKREKKAEALDTLTSFFQEEAEKDYSDSDRLKAFILRAVWTTNTKLGISTDDLASIIHQVCLTFKRELDASAVYEIDDVTREAMEPYIDAYAAITTCRRCIAADCNTTIDAVKGVLLQKLEPAFGYDDEGHQKAERLVERMEQEASRRLDEKVQEIKK